MQFCVCRQIRYFAALGNPGPRDFPEFISIFLKLFGKIWVSAVEGQKINFFMRPYDLVLFFF